MACFNLPDRHEVQPRLDEKRVVNRVNIPGIQVWCVHFKSEEGAAWGNHLVVLMAFLCVLGFLIRAFLNLKKIYNCLTLGPLLVTKHR